MVTLSPVIMNPPERMLDLRKGKDASAAYEREQLKPH